MKKERIDVLLVEQGFFDSREKAKRAIMAAMRLGDTPVPIPNTKVKTQPADGTASVWESRWPPG